MSSFEGYSAIAGVYDKLNKDIDYSGWADFFETCFEKYLGARPELVLDLACGTGRMTRELSARGYDMIGIDGSADMLGEAYSQGGEGILYLLQDMREFELYGTVGATVCCLDSLNYLLDAKDLKKTFSLVHNYSDPDALFMFDMNTPHKFERVYLQGKAEGLLLVLGGTPQFLEDPRRGLFSYEALRSRLCDSRFSDAEFRNLIGPVIRLRRLSEDELYALIVRVTALYAEYYNWTPRIGEREQLRFLAVCTSRAGADMMLTPREILRDYMTVLNILMQNEEASFDRILKNVVGEDAPVAQSTQESAEKPSFDPEDIVF